MKIGNIKFKAKRLDNGEWVKGDLAHSLDGGLNIFGFTRENGVDYYSGVHLINPTTVCQFTGLKDCKGNELYEHDVVKNYPFIPSEIVWSEEFSGYYLTCDNGKIYEKPLGYYLSFGEFIVVGNKFDKEK